jgi:hypothetical protein
MIDSEFLRQKNILPLALKYYDNPHCVTVSEFEEDFKRFKYIKKLLNRSECDIRLLLNHIVVVYNVFDRDMCTKMLFSYIEVCKWPKLKTVLSFLNLMPDTIIELKVVSDNIPFDDTITNELKRI